MTNAAAPAERTFRFKGYDVIVQSRALIAVQMHEPILRTSGMADDSQAPEADTKTWSAHRADAAWAESASTPVAPPARATPRRKSSDREDAPFSLATKEREEKTDEKEADSRSGWGWLADDVRAQEKSVIEADAARSVGREDLPALFDETRGRMDSLNGYLTDDRGHGFLNDSIEPRGRSTPLGPQAPASRPRWQLPEE